VATEPLWLHRPGLHRIRPPQLIGSPNA